jgi:hypothetical protein
MCPDYTAGRPNQALQRTLASARAAELSRSAAIYGGGGVMTHDKAKQELAQFVDAVRPFFPDLSLVIPRPIDVKVFPDECGQLRPPQSGMYILFRSSDDQLLYVGIANSIERRIYQHLGPSFSWARSGRQCGFPNMTLAADRPWLAQGTQDLLCRGDFQIQFIGVIPPQYAVLLEAFLVARALAKEGRPPEINVEF